MTAFFGANCSDPNGPIDGVRCTFTMPTPMTGGFFISLYCTNFMWGQVGVGWYGEKFYEVWLHGKQVIASRPPNKVKPLPPGPHVFEISLGSGTRWNFLVDGHAVGTYDMQASAALSDQILAVCENGNGAVPATMSGISVRRKGAWSVAAKATAEVVNLVTDFAIGVSGHLQDASIPVGAVRIGGPANITNGVPIW